MTYYRKIIGSKCYLSPSSVSDGKKWSRWLNISQEEAERMIGEIHSSMDKFFSIIDMKAEESIGIISLEEINLLYGSCEIKITITREKNWMNGIIEEAILLILDFAFNCLNMHGVSLWIPETETEKIGCLEKAGFKKMARRRESIKIGESYFDNIYLEILSREYSSIYINKHLVEMEEYRL